MVCLEDLASRRVDARQAPGRRPRHALGRPHHRAPLRRGRGRRRAVDPVHERQREGPEGRAADAREHPANLEGDQPGARVRPRRHHARQPAALPRVRPHGELVAAARARHDHCHLPQPARVPVGLQRRARRAGDGDGGHAGVPDRLPAEVRAGRFRERAPADHRRRQMPRVAAPRLLGEARDHPARGLRHHRDEPGHLRQHAGAQPPRLRRPGAAERAGAARALRDGRGVRGQRDRQGPREGRRA